MIDLLPTWLLVAIVVYYGAICLYMPTTIGKEESNE